MSIFNHNPNGPGAGAQLPIGGATMPGLGARPPMPVAQTFRHARTLDGNDVGLAYDFLSEGERKQLLHFARSPDAPWETYLPKSDVWHGRMINPRSMPPKILKLMEKIRRRTARHIAADYGITDPIYADTLQLVRWRVGDDQAAHADCEEPDGSPNQFPWRAFASIIYLNDEYEGGAIHFPKLGLRPELKPGLLAYFPSTANYLHGVEKITAGERFTFSCFYTFDKRRHDGLSV
ncbi:hypothetical protein GCM10022600_14220 [Qipengyuania pelagi]|jgi:hypothetical protein|uniref:procollagen-proline 3-dioxygenase n=1 Tax=Qipengyuania pelagi TaxID=994320 RepID=A0A844Y7B1_9SPHN|nr:2OG-Fe(II) oxygenase [Qipengyuania pelagi]MXO53716.1 hypothetical protein [Qipengyuania pelagi]